jgi:hypothetical protein
MEQKPSYNSFQIRCKISSTGGSFAKVGVIFLSLILLRIFFNKFDFSLMAFITFILVFAVFFYLFVILFYDPKVSYDDDHIHFKKFNRPEERISFKQIVRLSQNPQAYTRGLPGNYDYRIDFIRTDGKSGSIDFYSEESQEVEIRELITSIRNVNPQFIVDWTVPKKLRE